MFSLSVSQPPHSFPSATNPSVTQTEIRLFKPASAKGASKSLDDALCDVAAVTEIPQHGFALVCLLTDRSVRAYTLPGLKEIGRKSLPLLDASRTGAASLTKTGDVFGWTGPAEITVLPVWDDGTRVVAGAGLRNSRDTLVNPALACPPRPTISNFQWISGTQYVSPTDLDLLIGGPDRPASKRMVAAAAAERSGAGGVVAGGSGGAGASQEGWGDYLSRQAQERMEQLNIMGDSVDKLQESSSSWAGDVNKYVKKQQRGLLLGGLKKSFM